MGKGFKHGGSAVGSEMSFNVITCASEDDLPDASKTKINTIALITNKQISFIYADSKMHTFGYIPEDDPSKWPPIVWIRLDSNKHTDCNFGDIYLNIMGVYLQEHISTITAPVAAKICTYLGWEDIITNLYYDGCEYFDLTGGWVGTEDASNGKGTFTKTNHDITIKTSSTTAIYAHTTNAIDLSNVKSIHVNATYVKGTPFISIHAEGGKFDKASRVAYKEFNSETPIEEMFLDVSLYITEGNKYYIAIGSQADNVECTFDEVDLKYDTNFKSTEIVE